MSAIGQLTTKTRKFEAANLKDPPKDRKERGTFGMWYGVVGYYFIHRRRVEGG